MLESGYTSEIILNQNALQFNVDFLRKEMGERVCVSTVVKGNAYGHGIETFVPMAQDCGVQHFSVYSGIEAIRVKKSLKKPAAILIMGYLDKAQLEWAIENDIAFFVSNFEQVKDAIQIAGVLKKKCLPHLELETGMNRTGIGKSDLIQKIIPFLKKEQEHYTLDGVCTHFAGAEDIANYFRLKEQKERFLELKMILAQNGLQPKYIHTCCSAAALRFKDMRFNLVRVGILHYGFWPSQEIKIEYLLKNQLPIFNLKRVLRWRSKIVSVKDVSAGGYIGYGSSFRADTNMRVGIVPVGYAYGYSRTLSNTGTVLVHQKHAQVLGLVNMNLMTIDLRNIPQARPGSEVVLIGNQGDSEISVASFGEWSNQLNYELLTRLPEHIPRFVYQP